MSDQIADVVADVETAIRRLRLPYPDPRIQDRIESLEHERDEMRAVVERLNVRIGTLDQTAEKADRMLLERIRVLEGRHWPEAHAGAEWRQGSSR